MGYVSTNKCAAIVGWKCYIFRPVIAKSKGPPITGHQWPRGGVEVSLYSLSPSALGGGGWSAPRPGRFSPGKDPVPIVQEAGWAPGPVWTCAKNLACTGIRSPYRPARSQSLYQPSYPAHRPVIENGNFLIVPLLHSVNDMWNTQYTGLYRYTVNIWTSKNVQ
jgi:hypothetical protein